jgi:hypothetical protein
VLVLAIYGRDAVIVNQFVISTASTKRDELFHAWRAFPLFGVNGATIDGWN